MMGVKDFFIPEIAEIRIPISSNNDTIFVFPCGKQTVIPRKIAVLYGKCVF